jgi:arsenite methyltransferase
MKVSVLALALLTGADSEPPTPSAQLPTANAQLPTASAQFPTPNAQRSSPRFAPGTVWALAVGRWELQQGSQGHGLFPPTDLGLLESPDRAAWQKPEQIMDALRVADGSKVADIGAGAGWFTIRLARRVGPNGVVYAQDIQRQMLEAIKRRVSREGLQNVQTRLAIGNDPNLPARSLDALLVVDTYFEVDAENRVSYLHNLARALKPNGRIGIVNYKPGSGGPGPPPGERVESALVEENARAAGLRVLHRVNLPYQYLLVLGQ